jgi:uracil phosphoribosyltransferase
MRFRRNLERIGELAALEISTKLNYEEKEIQTPLGIAICKTLIDQPILATILRAGLPLHAASLIFSIRPTTLSYRLTGNTARWLVRYQS